MAQLKSTNVTGNLAVTGNINGGKILENGKVIATQSWVNSLLNNFESGVFDHAIDGLNDKFAAIIDGSQVVQNAVDADYALFASEAGSVAWSDVSGRPTSLPASDVYSWAKAASKPSYAWSEITSKPDTFTPPTASSSTLGGIKIGYTDGTVAGSFVQKGVKLDTNNKAYVEVTKKNITDILGYTPANSDNVKTYGVATDSTLGLIKTGFSESGKNYAVKVNNQNKAFVTVPLSDYLPKSGGSLYDSVDVTWTKYNRKMIINGNNITFDPTADTGTYAGSLLDVKHTKGTTTAIGVYGNYNEGLTHIFMGGSYYDPAMKMDASGNFTFKNLVTLTHDKAQLQFRGGHASYDGVISYQTSGNEAMLFTTKNAVTSFMFVNGEDTVKNVSSARWTALTPGLQIKNNKVSIGKLIADGVTPTYNLDVGGTANATTIYENGTALSDKYQAKGSGGSGMATVAYNVDLSDGDSIDLKPYINAGYKFFKGFIQTNDQVDGTIIINVNGTRFNFGHNYLDHHIEIIRFSDYNGGNHSIMIQGSYGNSMGWSQASGSNFYITYSLSNGGSVSASIALYAFK